MKDQEKHYSDKETKAIFQRALELQQSELQQDKGSEGINLREIQSIGSDLGINPRLIKQAAEDLDIQNRENKHRRFLGGPVRPRARYLLGNGVTDSVLKELSMGMSGIVGDEGQGYAMEGHLQWSSSGYDAMRTGSRIRVEVASVPSEGTDIEVRADLAQAAGGIFGGIMGGFGLGAGFGEGFGVGLGALGSPLFATLFPVGMLALSFVIARGSFSVFSRSQTRKINRIAAKVKDLLSRKGQSGTPSPSEK